MNKKTKVYTYKRVSTSMQVDGYSLDAQDDRITKYAEAFDFEIVGEYEDAGKSGKSIEGRAEFKKMLEDIESNKDGVSYVLVFKLSRFGRNAADVLSTLQFMQDYDVNLKKVYNEMALEYDSGPEGNYTRPHKEEIIKKVVLREGDYILDVACGNGYLLGELSKKARVNAFGVDISENMIAAARERYPACTFAVSSCTPLSYEKESIDIITVSCAFHHFEEPQTFANECMRVLKKNGKVVIAEPFFTPVVRWLANTVVFPFTKTGDVKVYSQKELQLFFKVAGFTTVESYTTGAVLFFSARK